MRKLAPRLPSIVRWCPFIITTFLERSTNGQWRGYTISFGKRAVCDEPIAAGTVSRIVWVCLFYTNMTVRSKIAWIPHAWYDWWIRFDEQGRWRNKGDGLQHHAYGEMKPKQKNEDHDKPGYGKYSLHVRISDQWFSHPNDLVRAIAMPTCHTPNILLITDG